MLGSKVCIYKRKCLKICHEKILKEDGESSLNIYHPVLAYRKTGKLSNESYTPTGKRNLLRLIQCVMFAPLIIESTDIFQAIKLGRPGLCVNPCT